MNFEESVKPSLFEEFVEEHECLECGEFFENCRCNEMLQDLEEDFV